ncbi:unnamed protein product [Rhizophagus irregularis]|nr:unnamed protein product [Rhizophagus irregularis]
MENVHTIWDSSTIGEGKKLGRPPNNRYSNNTKQCEVISLTQKLEVAIDNGLYLLDKCAELRNTCNKLTNENTQLRDGLEQSSKKLSKEIKQLLTDSKNVSNLEQQLAFDKQHIQSLTGELERLKSQYIVMQTTAAQHEVNLITSKKEVEVLNLRLKELESVSSEKITEIHSLESKLSSKTLELQKCEAEISSKSFELRTAKTECGVYKQHVSDMAEQSSIKKYQTQSPFPEKQNKETLGGGITELSFLYSTSLKRNNVSDTENHFVGKSHAQINIPLKEKLPYTFNSSLDKKPKTQHSLHGLRPEYLRFYDDIYSFR